MYLCKQVKDVKYIYHLLSAPFRSTHGLCQSGFQSFRQKDTTQSRQQTEAPT